jgi:hypothetical protein
MQVFVNSKATHLQATAQRAGPAQPLAAYARSALRAGGKVRLMEQWEQYQHEAAGLLRELGFAA